MIKISFQTVGLVALIVISLVAVVQLAKQNRHISELVEHEKNLEIGDKAYIFSATDLAGQRIDTKAAKVLLIFFSITCESCVKSIDSWKKLYEECGAQGIKVIGISGDPVERTKQFVKEHGLSFPIVADATHKIIWAYRVKFVPLVVLINQKGKILFYQQPDQSMQEAMSDFERNIRALF
jgi:peroxiredoxin